MGLKNNQNKDISVCIIGYGIIMLLDLISAITASIFINSEYIGISYTTLWVFITHFCVTFLSCLYVCKRAGEQIILLSGIPAIGYYITKIVASYLLFNGITSAAAIAVIPIMLGFISAVSISIRPKKHSRRRRNKR